MPDEAAITLIVDEAHHDRVVALAAELNYGWSYDPEDGVFENHEAPWGSNYVMDGGWADGALGPRLIAERIGFRLIDWGHWSWQASEIGWRPPMEAPVQRLIAGGDGGGDPMLDSRGLMKLVTNATSWGSMISMLTAHWDDDPAQWLGDQVAYEPYQPDSEVDETVPA